MTTWVERREKVQDHSAFIKWRQLSEQENVPFSKPIGPPRPSARCLRMARYPPLKAVSFNDLAQKYGAIDFQDALADFIAVTIRLHTYADTSDCLVYFFFFSLHRSPCTIRSGDTFLASRVRYDLTTRSTLFCTISISEPCILRYLVLGEFRSLST